MLLQVHFQPIPAASELQAILPLGRPVLSTKALVMPLPAFGPGSADYEGQHVADPLEVGDNNHDEQSANRDGLAMETTVDKIRPPALAVWGDTPSQSKAGGEYF